MSVEDEAVGKLMAFKQRLDAKEMPFVSSSQYQPSVVRETWIKSPLTTTKQETGSTHPKVPWPAIEGGKPCCLYPWPGDPGAGTPLYPATDLPDTLNLVSDGSGSIPAGTYVFTKDPTAPSYTTTISGTTAFLFGQGGPPASPWPSSLWSVSSDFGVFVNERCSVVQPPGSYSPDLSITDNFTPTYTVNGVDTVTRVAASSCKWTGPKTGGGMWRLEYGQATPFTWHLHSASSDDDKTAPQSSPAGTYGTNTVA